ncbi:MAG TPA: DUF3810 domain-containing protein [Sediminibacterium sp.]|nr:DUF3810 domain-containing protein [Sediminibacterium sp.]
MAMRLAMIIDENRFKKTIILFFAAFLVYLAGFFPGFVEKWYALGFYPLFAAFLRFCFGWLPFSVGDLLYGLLGGWLLVVLIRWFRSVGRKGISVAGSMVILGKLFRFACAAYLVFYLFWGLNYNRLGITLQLSAPRAPYSRKEITALTRELIAQANASRRALKDTLLPEPDIREIFDRAARGYRLLEPAFPFLRYHRPSVKPSLYNAIADYVGFTGYYAPLTGEAQVRTDLPRVMLPFITSHEMAHQLGYASESEASFVGYLAATASKDPYFCYSAYLDLLGYAQGQEFLLYAKENSYTEYESVLAGHRSLLDSLVIKDRKMIREFFLQRQNRVAPVSSDLYDQFLKWNKQLAGINSYDEVISWLIAYKKKYGSISFRE